MPSPRTSSNFGVRSMMARLFVKGDYSAGSGYAGGLARANPICQGRCRLPAVLERRRRAQPQGACHVPRRLEGRGHNRRRLAHHRRRTSCWYRQAAVGAAAGDACRIQRRRRRRRRRTRCSVGPPVEGDAGCVDWRITSAVFRSMLMTRLLRNVARSVQVSPQKSVLHTCFCSDTLNNDPWTGAESSQTKLVQDAGRVD